MINEAESYKVFAPISVLPSLGIEERCGVAVICTMGR
jgi:hypothetical protein